MSRRSTNGISIYTSSTREPSPQKHGGPDGTGCAPSAMLAQKRSLADPPPSHDGQSQAIVAPAQRRLLHVARTLAHDRSRWGSLNSALTASSDDWHALEAPVNDIGSLLAQEPDPFRSMAEMRTPGVIIRGAYPAADVPKLVQRLIDRRLMRGPDDPVELTADGTLCGMKTGVSSRDRNICDRKPTVGVRGVGWVAGLPLASISGRRLVVAGQTKKRS
jgi:hypothetical protein